MSGPRSLFTSAERRVRDREIWRRASAKYHASAKGKARRSHWAKEYWRRLQATPEGKALLKAQWTVACKRRQARYGALTPAEKEAVRRKWRRDYHKLWERREREFVAKVRALIPSTYPADVRDDVVSEVMLAVLERRLPRADVEGELPSFIRAYWREHPRLGVVSLDAPIFPGGPALVDTIEGTL